jgi:long-chain fatty acid transport protein
MIAMGILEISEIICEKFHKTVLFQLLVFVLVSMLFTPFAFSAGFSLYEGGARSNALGGAMTGRADDLSALYFNPAGITQLPGLRASVGATMIAPSVDIITTNGTKITSSEKQFFVLPQTYITHQLNDKIWLGLGMFPRFGLGVEYPSNWPGRFNVYKAQLNSLDINPNVVYKVTDNLSVAAGTSLMYFDMAINEKVKTSWAKSWIVSDIDAKITGDSSGYGYNLGLHYRATDWLSLGTSYRSQVTQHPTGSMKFEWNGFVKKFYEALPRSVDCEGTINLPDQYSLGIMVKPAKNISVEVGGTITNWSSYRELKIELAQPVGGKTTLVSPKNWNDSWRYHIGAEWNATDLMDIRFSYVHDQSPIPDDYFDYSCPDSDRNIVGAGFGLHKNSWVLDVSYNYLMLKDRTISKPLAKGVLPSIIENGNAHIVGVTMGYKF